MMKKYSCLIVDDEKLGRELIKTHLSKIESLEVIKECKNALEAMDFLRQNEVDVLFLDINMPHLSGIDFLKQLSQKPLTILTTAYSDYAIEGYELDVADYLLKPITFERFYKAVSKVLQLLEQKKRGSLLRNTTQEKPPFFFVKSEYKKIKIDVANILYIEALQKYIRIHSKEQKVMTLMSLSKVMDFLPENSFLRIHRSYIINIKAIQFIEGNMVGIADKKLPVSKGHRDILNDFIIDY